MFSVVQTGHLVSVAREGGTKPSEQGAVQSPLAPSDCLDLMSVSLTSPQTEEFLDLLLQLKIVIV